MASRDAIEEPCGTYTPPETATWQPDRGNELDDTGSHDAGGTILTLDACTTGYAHGTLTCSIAITINQSQSVTDQVEKRARERERERERARPYVERRREDDELRSIGERLESARWVDGRGTVGRCHLELVQHVDAARHKVEARSLAWRRWQLDRLWTWLVDWLVVREHWRYGTRTHTSNECTTINIVIQGMVSMSASVIEMIDGLAQASMTDARGEGGVAIARHWRKYCAHTNATALVAHRTLPMPSKNGASDVAACWSSDASDSPSGTATRAPGAMALYATRTGRPSNV